MSEKPADVASAERTKPTVTDLMGAEARAILSAVGKAIAKVEALENELTRQQNAFWALNTEAKKGLVATKALAGTVEELKRAGDDVRQHLERLRGLAASLPDVATSVARLEGRMDGVEAMLKQVIAQHEGLADRVAEAVLKVTLDQRKLEGKVAVIRAEQREGAVAEGHALGAREGSRPSVRPPLPSMGELDEVTSSRLLAHVLKRAETDAQFQRDAARAGVGLHEARWRTLLKWGTTIIGSLTAGGLLAKALMEWLQR